MPGLRITHVKALLLALVIAMAGAPLYVAAKTVDKGGKSKFTLCLDPGHGGKDFGCIGKKTNEKTIVLNVATKLRDLLEKHLDDFVDVVMTRSDDRFVTLQGRADVANDAHSDLFMSIHVNSVAKSNKRRNVIEGCQVYTLGLHKTAENLAVAKRENAAMEMEHDHKERYASFDMNSLEGDILFEFAQSQRLDRSIELADALQNSMVSHAEREPLGVRQAGFWVLWATSAPAVLIELDFICNPESEKFLDSDSGTTRLAESIYNAFASYLNTYGPPLLGREVNAREL